MFIIISSCRSCLVNQTCYNTECSKIPLCLVLSICVRFPLYLVFVGASLLFLLVNLACALLVKMTDAQVKTIVLVRVTINDSLFVLCAISLSICLYKVAKMSLASIYLESKVHVLRRTINTIRAIYLSKKGALHDFKSYYFEVCSTL